MRSLGAEWAGEAATNAGTTLQRAADWSQGAGAGHAAAGQTVEGYGQSFESLRGQVHWDDPWAWGWNDTASAAAVGGHPQSRARSSANLTTDYFTTAQQNRTNDAVAVAALRAHEQQTRAAVGSFPAIAPAGIDPSSADRAAPADRREGLGPAPVAPTPVATAVRRDRHRGSARRGRRRIAAGLGAAAGAAARSAEPTGGGTGAGGSGTAGGGGGGAPIGPTPEPRAQPLPDRHGGPHNRGSRESRRGRSRRRGRAGSRPAPCGGGAAQGVSAQKAGRRKRGWRDPAGRAGWVSQIGQGGLGRQGAPGGGAGTPSRSTAIPNVPSPGDEAPGAAHELTGRQRRPGLPAGPAERAAGWRSCGTRDGAPPLGSEASGGGRGPSEPGALSRGPASGTEFAARLPSGSPETPPAAARAAPRAQVCRSSAEWEPGRVPGRPSIAILLGPLVRAVRRAAATAWGRPAPGQRRMIARLVAGDRAHRGGLPSLVGGPAARRDAVAARTAAGGVDSRRAEGLRRGRAGAAAGRRARSHPPVAGARPPGLVARRPAPVRRPGRRVGGLPCGRRCAGRPPRRGHRSGLGCPAERRGGGAEPARPGASRARASDAGHHRPRGPTDLWWPPAATCGCSVSSARPSPRTTACGCAGCPG